VHTAEPVTEANVPAAQLLQSAAAEVATNVPAAQLLQPDWLTAVENFPGGHLVQEAASA